MPPEQEKSTRPGIPELKPPADTPQPDQAPFDASAPEKSTPDTLVEVLGKFIQEQANLPLEPELDDRITKKQYISLSLFCCNLIILYLTFTAVVYHPVWHLVGKIVPLALGSGFIVAKSKQLQKWLLAQSQKNSFMFAMFLALFFLGTIGSSQLPIFKVPVKVDARVVEFCAEEVEGISEVESAVESSKPMSHSHCVWKPQLSKDIFIKHLKIGKNYMITVHQEGQSKPFRYYLPFGTVLKKIFWSSNGLKLDSTVLIELPEGLYEKTIIIQRKDTDSLIYIPRGCGIDEEALSTTKCPHDTKQPFYFELMPDAYSFTVEGCNQRVEVNLSAQENAKTTTIEPKYCPKV